MRAENRRIVSGVASGGFMVAAVTGLVFAVPISTILLRALIAALATGAICGIVVVVIERLWTK